MIIKTLIKNHDKQNQFQTLIDSYKQIEFAWNNEVELNAIKTNELDNIIVSGMGGSAISADILNCFLYDELQLPLFVNRDYHLPKFASKKTLSIISSYSGNTEETISCLKEAIERECKIIAISTGGVIKDLANENNIFWISLQEGFQPRFALGASLFTLLKIFQLLKLIPNQNQIVDEIKLLWKKKGIKFSEEENHALKTAEELIGFLPLIYTSEKFGSIGYRYKCQFNENSKLHAFNNVIPELNHNEIIGWETFLDKQLNTKLLLILDEEYDSQISKRFEITQHLVQKNEVDIIELKSNEKNIKVRIMDLIYLGDWITFYLAVLRGFDPSEIDYINYLKQRLA